MDDRMAERVVEIEARIVELEAEKSALPRRERRPISQQIHLLREVLDWCTTRAGYRPPAA